VPHVVIEGSVDLLAYAREFEALVVRRHEDVLRADEIFVERGGRVALVSALAIESGRKLPFYVKISVHDRGSTTIRIDPRTHPERSDGVREIVARIGADLLRKTPDAQLGVTNLVLPSSDDRSKDSSEDRSGGSA